MNKRKKEFYPKKGWFIELDKLPILGNWSVALGFNREVVQHYMKGYDNDITHHGYKTEIFAIFFDYQFAFGYNSVKEVKEVV
ncbi:hypothetical protein QJS65_10545 [Bacillus altitudinis]|uniref:hypothetical protein n=1 Tax=Bacillus altitudinis TaxID=293387 RepID=UPI0024A93E4E|nr:hypothetical protein [Bacillus altitudinis]WHF25288.1 hypothetical protein QJS65_10545 [Bacillus altitudinis]